MRIAMLNLGTRGDIHPFVALAAELDRRGHRVTVGVSANLVGVPRRLGLPTVPIGWDTERLIDSPAGQNWVAAADPASFVAGMHELTREHGARLDDEVVTVCAGAQAIVTGALTETRAMALAEAGGLPLIVQDCFPRRPNDAVPHPLVSPRPLGSPAANRASHLSFARLTMAAGGEQLARFRHRLGLPARPAATGRRPLLLQTYSPSLVPAMPAQPDRPLVGDLRMSPADLAALGQDTVDEALASWLEAGEPPVFVTFGSTRAADPAGLLDTVGRCCAAAGLRAVVATGWGLPAAAGDRPELFVTRYVDYDTLLPRCVAAVHHGSASITAAVARAGLPALVCSSFYDQPFWGERVAALGAGAHLRFADLDGPRLADGLRTVLDPGYRAVARRLGQRLRAEPPGTLVAADHVERHLAA